MGSSQSLAGGGTVSPAVGTASGRKRRAKPADDAGAAGTESSLRRGASRMSIVDDDDSDGPEEETDDEASRNRPLSAMSLEKAFPTGDLGRSMGRIRQTINGYVQKLSAAGWYDEMNLATAKAVQKRLSEKRRKIDQSMNLELVAGWQDMRCRIKAYIGLYKDLQVWAGSNIDGDLVKVLQHKVVLDPVMSYFDAGYSPELCILFATARFLQSFQTDFQVQKVEFVKPNNNPPFSSTGWVY